MTAGQDRDKPVLPQGLCIFSFLCPKYFSLQLCRVAAGHHSPPQRLPLTAKSFLHGLPLAAVNQHNAETQNHRNSSQSSRGQSLKGVSPSQNQGAVRSGGSRGKSIFLLQL